MSSQQSSSGFVNGFIAGGIATAAFLYFFTTRSGREHTKRFLDATEDIEEGVADIFDEILDRHAAPNHPPVKEETPHGRLLAAGSRFLKSLRSKLESADTA